MISYEIPDLMDPRALNCADHHPACNCREAHLNEVITEFREEHAAIVRAAREVLRGHQYYMPDTMLCPGCQCSGCQIARRCYLLGTRGVDLGTGLVR